MSSETPPPLPVIEYDTPPRADHVRRRTFLIVLIVAAVFGAMLLGLLMTRVVRSAGSSTATVRIAPAPPSPVQQQQAQYQMQVQWGQQRLDGLLASAVPAGTVAYAEDPADAATLKAQGGVEEASRQNMSQPTWGAFQPPVFTPSPFKQEHAIGDSPGLLFAHERFSPKGNRRLVLFEIAATLDVASGKGEEVDIKLRRQLRYRICDTTLFTTAPSVLRYGHSLAIAQSGPDGDIIPIRWIDGSLRASRSAEKNLKFYAGQIDPKDKSHFTIDYAVGKQSNTIDVWLTDDDFLKVIPRGGKIDGGTWRIDQ